ncbi:MAG TPA: hypothetical protein VFN35_02325, partial [Ktedonobacteraceae bacterium]|nr:hypothetical protein [Ktedonobacteraceae bacterium]
MYRANAPRNVALLLSIISFLLIYPLSSCADNPASSIPSTPVQGNSQGAITPGSTLALPSEGVAAIVPVSSHPNIIVQSGSAVQLTFVGADT